MQLLKLVVLNISVEVCTVHGIGIILVRDWAVLPCTRMPGRDHTFLHDTSMMRSGAVIMHVIGGKTPAADLPQGTVILIMVWQVLITFEAIQKGGGGPRLLMLLAREEVNVSLQNCPTLKAVATIFVDPF